MFKFAIVLGCAVGLLVTGTPSDALAAERDEITAAHTGGMLGISIQRIKGDEDIAVHLGKPTPSSSKRGHMGLMAAALSTGAGRMTARPPTIGGRNQRVAAQFGQTSASRSPAGLAATIGAAVERAKDEPGTWQPVKESELRPALLTKSAVKSAVSNEIWGHTGPSAAIVAWSGLAFDKDRGCAYAMGGGHKAYGGNEAYAYCWKEGHGLTTVADAMFAGAAPPQGEPAPVGVWFQLTPQGKPRPPKDVDGDGTVEECRGYEYGPNPTHGYDAWDVAPDGNVYRWGAAGYCQQGWGGGPGRFWQLNPETKEWKRYANGAPTAKGPNFAVQTPYHGLLLGLTKGFFSFTPPDSYKKVTDFNGKWDYGVGAYGGGWYIGFHKHKKYGLIALKIDNQGNVTKKHVPLWDVQKLKNAIAGWPWNGSIVYHNQRGVFTIWEGKSTLWTLEPGTWRLTRYDLPADDTPQGRQIYNSHIYLEDQNVLMAYTDDPDQPWFVYALPDRAQGVDVFAETERKKAELQDQGFTCADTVIGWSCPSLSSAVTDGGDVTLPKGIYRQCAVVDQQTTLDMQGSHIENTVCERKGTFVQNANFTLKNVTIRGARGSQGNEAAIRRQSGATTLENVSLIDNHNGVLGGTGEPFVMHGGLVQGNGCCAQVYGKPAGRAHGIYIANGVVEIGNTTFRAATGKGHLLKSGAKKLTIVNSTFDETGGNGSRVIDAYNGGELVVKNSKITSVADDGNSDAIGYDYEARQRHADNAILIKGGSVDCAGGQLIAGENSVSGVKPQIEARVTRCR